MSARMPRHEKLVTVPRDVRVELVRRLVSRRRVAEVVGVSEATADALLSPYGVVRPEVIERARAFLAAKKEAS